MNIVLTPANFGYVADVPGWPYDPARARALIKQAGAEGAVLSFITSPAYDRRLNEAVQWIASRRQSDGRWLLDRCYDEAHAVRTKEAVGEPSRWITLRALRMLRWHGAITEAARR